MFSPFIFFFAILSVCPLLDFYQTTANLFQLGPFWGTFAYTSPVFSIAVSSPRCGDSGIRTHDPLFAKQMLLPSELYPPPLEARL